MVFCMLRIWAISCFSVLVYSWWLAVGSALLQAPLSSEPVSLKDLQSYSSRARGLTGVIS